ncbi:hypothetical protein ACQH8C_27485, partial [Escherichia coli]|uniref:hypothetical protein n=1 Tax=Escherichia coli TaxID=562 RepID=UPI003CED532B
MFIFLKPLLDVIVHVFSVFPAQAMIGLGDDVSLAYVIETKQYHRTQRQTSKSQVQVTGDIERFHYLT